METTGIPKSPSLHTQTPTSRILPLVSYVFLALSAMLALFAHRVSWLPPEVTWVAPWAFLCFAGGFGFYRGMLVLAGRYSPFKAFAQILFAGLFFLLLLNSTRRTGMNLSYFNHADASVRLMAVKLCGYEPQDNCRAAVRQSLNDPSDEVRAAAAKSLERLGGEAMSAKLDEGVRVFDRFIAERGLKSTWQRNAILTAFFEMRGHITVEELWAKVRLVDDRVSVATVYRTMKLLAESGLVHVRDFGDGQARYEAAVGRETHDHLICTRCQKIVEFEREEVDRLQRSIATQHRFSVTSRKLVLYGLCEGCSA